MFSIPLELRIYGFQGRLPSGEEKIEG